MRLFLESLAWVLDKNLRHPDYTLGRDPGFKSTQGLRRQHKGTLHVAMEPTKEMVLVKGTSSSPKRQVPRQTIHMEPDGVRIPPRAEEVQFRCHRAKFAAPLLGRLCSKTGLRGFGDWGAGDSWMESDGVAAEKAFRWPLVFLCKRAQHGLGFQRNLACRSFSPELAQARTCVACLGIWGKKKFLRWPCASLGSKGSTSPLELFLFDADKLFVSLAIDCQVQGEAGQVWPAKELPAAEPQEVFSCKGDFT